MIRIMVRFGRGLRRPRQIRRSILAALTVLPLGQGCTGVPAGVEPMTDFRAEAFAGTWYAVMRFDHPFEQGLNNVRATYRPQPDGTLAVFNRAWNPETCAWETVSGQARFLDGPEVARFGVTLRGGLIEGGLHVLDMDPAGRSWALLGGPTRDYLWILSRAPQMDDGQRRALMREARDRGYPVERFQRVDQGGPVCRGG